MKILISGAGQVGFYLCERLASEGHEVVLVDRSQERLKLAEEQNLVHLSRDRHLNFIFVTQLVTRTRFIFQNVAGWLM